ncbi:hypothetical protein [Spiroplasma endosymbiont of Othius punctulatus]|uniref:hypothetical protein n=1 Tax=Spiroplasma endosymbiont of Othius punctulatus TaxID=3066289 RepID=UPI0030CEC76D
MKLTNEQYKEMSNCLGKEINEDTDFQALSYELQGERRDLIQTMSQTMQLAKSVMMTNDELVKQNKQLLNSTNNKTNTTPQQEKRILN